MLVPVARFDQDASRYHAEVYQRKRSDLSAQLNTKLRLLFIGQLKNLRSSCGSELNSYVTSARANLCAGSFKRELLDGLKIEDYDFASVIGGAHEKWEAKFSEVAAGAHKWLAD